ncbi:mechanosensitive ion channel protein MscS [Veronia nyctiphanis]|uniref:Mechanosensitive ion channel protein MscS n=1 Tax=Veronia nyctiphanis TaxID=1278244 RepID=A0A4Q0YPV1_9GAMM|nr:mechanosensitive ion channel family protein [Veronia nyctiphanis]RXJ73012.1 mechanosensitive ion channel protein MscS [Veronia nyctiphanis]
MQQFLASIHKLMVEYDLVWLETCLYLLLLSTIVWAIWRVVLKKLEAVVVKTRTAWDEILVSAASTPISVIIWVFPFTIAIADIFKALTGNDPHWVGQLREFAALAIFVWFVLRLINRGEEELLTSEKRDKTTVAAISNLLRMVITVFVVLSVLQELGISLTGLLTFGGVGGLIVGLAAKDLLSNFFGGMMIYFDRPFKVGDWIRSPDRKIEGTVEKIGLRVTIIRTFDKRPLYVPNSVFSNIVVENPSRMSNRQIKESMGIRYEDAGKMQVIIEDVRSMLASHPEIDNRQTLIVNFDHFGDSSLNFFIYTFTKTVNWIHFHEIKQDVMLKIVEIVHQHGADFAFPTRTLMMESGASEAPRDMDGLDGADLPLQS